MKMNFLKRISWKEVVIGIVLAFLYLPIVYVVLFSFNASKSLTRFTGFSLQWYEKMFQSSSMMSAVYYTILVAVVATVVSTIVGTLSAIGLSKSNKLVKELVTQVNNLPMLNPDIVTAIGWMLLFAALHVQKGLMTLIISHIAFCIPYVMLSVTPRLRQLDDNVAEAALDLGCTPFQAIYKVIIPQIMPSIISGALVAFTMSFDDFVISYFVTGPGISNISTFVYTAARRVNPSINALSSLIVAGIAVIMFVMYGVPAINKKKGKKLNEKTI